MHIFLNALKLEFKGDAQAGEEVMTQTCSLPTLGQPATSVPSPCKPVPTWKSRAGR